MEKHKQTGYQIHAILTQRKTAPATLLVIYNVASFRKKREGGRGEYAGVVIAAASDHVVFGFQIYLKCLPFVKMALAEYCLHRFHKISLPLLKFQPFSANQADHLR